MDSLYQHSIKIILQNQKDSGAILASPNFPTYQYAWFRDGSYTAHALLQAGYLKEAGQFHLWASRVVLGFREKMQQCIADAQAGRPIIASACLHSRFSADGEEVPGNWGHHQLDGLGTWLWSLGEYWKKLHNPAGYESCLQAAELTVEYLSALWLLPCSDCWEENETLKHTYTLGAITAGLRGYAEMSDDANVLRTAQQIQKYIFYACQMDGAFTKSIGLCGVDANLIGLCVPFEVVSWSDPVFQATLAKIENQLATPVGVHRYAEDTYYGGGEWVLLTAWLGWAYARAGDLEKAKTICAWVEAQQDENGSLPEQIPHALFNPQEYEIWVKRWGPVATPLVWSHATYILLKHAVQVP
jgi:GH15 family glucan-1,4-alpha-glucosidase